MKPEDKLAWTLVEQAIVLAFAAILIGGTICGGLIGAAMRYFGL